MKIFAKLKGIYVLIEFSLTVFIIIILMYLFPKKNREIRRKWAKLQSKLIGYKVEVKGEIDPSANLLLINHQSLLDIVVLEEIHPANLAWVGKKEIEKLPLFGHIMKAPKMIVVDREDKKSLIKLLKDAKDRLKEKRVIAIFPEGTRSKGDKLLPFKNGPKFLAKKLNLKVQPVVVVNTRAVLDSKTLEVNTNKPVKVIFLDSFYPNEKDENWYEELREEMERVLKKELEKQNSN